MNTPTVQSGTSNGRQARGGLSPTVAPTIITERELKQVERANATAATPVVFIHGLWLLPSSWEPWAGLFEQAGYVALTPSWPDDPETVEMERIG
jgi:non-heme chloroperoxidase